MSIKSIHLKNFKSYKEFNLENISPNTNLLVGKNGQGKSNFL